MGAKGGDEEQEVEAQLRLGSHSSDASFQENRGVDPVLPGHHFCLRGIGPLAHSFSTCGALRCSAAENSQLRASLHSSSSVIIDDAALPASGCSREAKNKALTPARN